MCLVFLFKAFQVTLRDLYNTHVTCIIFKGYKKKLKRYFSWFFFLYVKMANKYYQKHKERLMWKISKSFRKRKKQKAKKVPERHQIFTEEEKEDKCQY